MAKIPYFPFYPDDWISSPKVMMMTMEQRGIYITLLAHAWNFPGGSLPDDMSILQRFCHGARRINIQYVLDTCFERRGNEGGDVAWMNPRLLHERSRAITKHSKAKESANYRWNKEKQDANAERTQSERNANQNQNQNQNHKKKNLKKEGEKKNRFSPPSLEEIKEYCQERKNNIDPQAFLDSNTAKGWVIGKFKTPAKDWKAMIRTWEKTEAKNYGLQSGGSGGKGESARERRSRIDREATEASRRELGICGERTPMAPDIRSRPGYANRISGIDGVEKQLDGTLGDGSSLEARKAQ
jgi:uncharacterized protein YdaU (DUF1376 family)